jgi:glycosyltransferase involved in cell wall biosynthesis
MLIKEGFDAKLVEVTDGNDIDREVFSFRPEVVIIEALWVTPEKLAEVQILHPQVKWVVRLHSEVPFIALEGIAVLWLRGYWKIPNVFVAANTEQARIDYFTIQSAVGAWSRLLNLPTYYPPRRQVRTPLNHTRLHVICPGSIRPLKNQFTQAVAALRYAEEHDKRLVFYINTTRCEQNGQEVFKNLVNLFKGTPHELFPIDWLSHEDFLKLLARMDLGVQVSFSETFNICAADLVTCGVPVVTSDQVTWTSRLIHADPTDTKDIAHKMSRALIFPNSLQTLNFMGLEAHAHYARKQWLTELGSL